MHMFFQSLLYFLKPVKTIISVTGIKPLKNVFLQIQRYINIFIYLFNTGDLI